jgi:hypothetical protein
VVSGTPSGSGFTAIAAGGAHSLALLADGSILSWGRDNRGQVSNTPTTSGFTAIAAGGGHSLALDTSGTIHSWGYDGDNQVTDTPAGTDFTAIAAGSAHSLALDTSGTIHSWGYDGNNQVTDTPTAMGFSAITGGLYHSLALKADGSIYSWGFNLDNVVSGTPSGSGFTAIAAGYDHSLALQADFPIPAAIGIWSTVLHPHHDDVNVSPFLDDVIPVIVFGTSTLVGDSDDLDTDLIDSATLRFGPGLGAISPSHPPSFYVDLDSDGLDDAVFRFLASDAAFDKVTCSDTSGTLAGELTTGETFEGTNSFISDCNAQCH